MKFRPALCCVVVVVLLLTGDVERRLPERIIDHYDVVVDSECVSYSSLSEREGVKDVLK